MHAPVTPWLALCRPFLDLKGINVAVRVGNRAHTLRDFKLRLVPAEELKPVPIGIANRVRLQLCVCVWPCKRDAHPTCGVLGLWQHLSRMASLQSQVAPESPLTKLSIVDREDAHAVLRRFGNTDLTPWLRPHRHELNRTLRCQPHEMFDHPAVNILVVASTNSDPMACFQELASRHHLPAVFHSVRRV